MNSSLPPSSSLSGIRLVSAFFLLLTLVFGGIFLNYLITELIFSSMDLSKADFFAKMEIGNLASFDRNLLRYISAQGHTATFLLPALVFAKLIYRDRWRHQLQINRLPNLSSIGLSFLLLLGTLPLVQLSMWCNQQITLPEWAAEMENQTGGLIEALLVMNNTGELFFSLVLMAVLPALGEELIFRGIIQRTLEKMINNKHIVVLVSGFIFSVFHFQFAGVLPRWLLGILLGYVFLWTRNLWIPVLIHFFFNGSQVVAAWLMEGSIEEKASTQVEFPSWGVIIFSAIFVPLIAKLLMKRHYSNTNPTA